MKSNPSLPHKVLELYVLKKDLTSNEFLNKLIKKYGEEIQNSLFILDANKMKTWEALFVEFQKVMQFPDYFGHNLDAFEECMRDLYEWIEGINEYIILIINSKNLLINETNKQTTLIDSFNFIGEELSKAIQYEDKDNVNNRKAYPFHVILSENMRV